MSQFDRIEQSQIEKIAKKVLAGGGGSGTVTSVGSGTGLTGGPITTSGTLSVVYGTSGTSACVGNDPRLNDARTPTAHTHPQSEITDLVADLAGKAAVSHTHAIADVTGLQTALDGKASTSHTHAIADVTGLQTALDGKSAVGHTHAIADVTGLQTALDGKSDTGHGHIIADVSGLQTALDGKSNTGHGHVISDVSGLQTALDGKASTSHTHTVADITDIGTIATLDATITSLGNKELLQYNSGTSVWENVTLSEAGIPQDLGELPSVTITSVTNDEVLQFTGTVWENQTLAEAGISAVGHTHSAADVTTGTFNIARIPTGTTASDVCIGDDARLSDPRTPTAHTHPLSDLTQSGASSGDVATWNGSAWAPAAPSGGGAPTSATYITQVAEAGLSAEFALSSMTTGIVKVTNGTGALTTAVGSDLPSDIPVGSLAQGGASAGDVLTWSGLGYWTPAAPSGGGGGASAIDDLTDVDTTTVAPTQGDILVFDGTNWIPGRARPSVQPISGNRIVGTIASLSLGTQQSTGYNNRLRAFPFLCHRSFSASGLTIACTTAQAATTMEVQLALYEAGDDGWPTGLPIEYMSGSSLNGTSVGFKTFTFGSPRTIVANKMYWTASRWLLVSGTAPTWRACTTSSGWELATTSAYNTTTAPYWNINISHTYGSSSAWHNFTTTPITTITQLATTSLPCVWVDVA